MVALPYNKHKSKSYDSFSACESWLIHSKYATNLMGVLGLVLALESAKIYKIQLWSSLRALIMGMNVKVIWSC